MRYNGIGHTASAGPGNTAKNRRGGAWQEVPVTEIRKPIQTLVIIEAVALVCAGYDAYRISAKQVFEKRSAVASVRVAEFTDEKAVDLLLEAYDDAMLVPADDVVWTKEETPYKTSPSSDAKDAGTLDKYAQLVRNAKTRTGWSRVVIEEKEYFVKNDVLIDELPFTVAPGAKGELQLYALSQFSQFGWADSELQPLINLWNRESGWNPNSHNRRSGAHGIPQALPGRKMASEGSDWSTNGRTQIRWGLKYIRGRYGSPSSAWAHFRSKGWY